MNQHDLVILMPVFNDWRSVERLLRELDNIFGHSACSTRVLLVDDRSVDEWNGPHDPQFQCLETIEVLRLRRNLGHQRAICIGLCYIEEKIPCDYVAVMDSDGEDDPADVPRLLARCREEGGSKIVFAERTRRSESMVFRTLYHLYRIIHFMVVGHRVRVGNFSVIPVELLRSLTVVSEMWSHYAAAVFAARLPHCQVPTTRAQRLEGASTMGFVSLVARVQRHFGLQ